jgi:hypothetical protein
MMPDKLASGSTRNFGRFPIRMESGSRIANMAYMSQDKKKRIEAVVKPILKKYGIKGRLGVDNHSTLVLNIKAGEIDFIRDFNETVPKDSGFNERLWSAAKDYIDVNPYHYDKHFSGKAKKFLSEVLTAMNNGNHDNSDIQSDYFDIGWFISVRIGKWNKPYILI